MSTTNQTGTPWKIYGALVMGIAGVSMAAIIVRFAQQEQVSSLSIAALRLTFASLMLTPFVWARHSTRLRALTRRDFILASIGGFFLAIHFAAWISSLEYTSVLISVVLVSTGPLWVALLEVFVLKGSLTRTVVMGLGIAILGTLLIGIPGSSASLGSNPQLGGSLALIAAMAFAVYLTIGRNLRSRLSILPYIWLVYTASAVFLLVAAILSGSPLAGLSTTAYFWMFVLAAVPQLIGHSSMNYALGHLSATYVSIASQMEPIGSAIAAFILFQETPTALQILGSVAILIGVAMATLGQSKAEA